MANFPSITPSYGQVKNSNPNFLETKYGDGYSSRLVFGLNQNLKRYDLAWNNLSESNSDTIETFLDARGGSESFTFTPAGESSGTYICRSWRKTINYLNRASINATFEQVAEP